MKTTILPQAFIQALNGVMEYVGRGGSPCYALSYGRNQTICAIVTEPWVIHRMRALLQNEITALPYRLELAYSGACHHRPKGSLYPSMFYTLAPKEGDVRHVLNVNSTRIGVHPPVTELSSIARAYLQQGAEEATGYRQFWELLQQQRKNWGLASSEALQTATAAQDPEAALAHLIQMHVGEETQTKLSSAVRSRTNSYLTQLLIAVGTHLAGHASAAQANALLNEAKRLVRQPNAKPAWPLMLAGAACEIAETSLAAVVCNRDL